MSKIALIVGAGSGNSAAFARALAAEGYRVVLAARNITKLDALCAQINAHAISCDATSVDSVRALFDSMQQDVGSADVVLYNASAYTAGPVTSLDPELVLDSLMQTAYGAFLVAQQATIGMKQLGGGALFFTGATASVKGFPNFAPFAMGKFALRGLAQSLARELGPDNIHVAHFIIDGGIASPGRDLSSAEAASNANDAELEPDAIAQTYMAVLNQHRSAWTQEIDLRPWVENF
ncbi:MAG: SDR family NAD(P)-dependent oxidoreductase [Gammaproteobacteria bacterium]|nr:SDR family NAD(P)-dependent oxidoreductase [Gammaproteobacteria bacterium]MDH3536155.1 SDR family NAD(P)-dependent oxidoreductase [Gammaproteobacteria bacterium]